MKFLGRAEQRKKLHRILDKDSQAVSLIYGRRRVGKSELIKQVLRESDIAGIYYECKQTTEMNNVESLAVLIAGNFICRGRPLRIWKRFWIFCSKKHAGRR